MIEQLNPPDFFSNTRPLWIGGTVLNLGGDHGGKLRYVWPCWEGSGNAIFDLTQGQVATFKNDFPNIFDAVWSRTTEMGRCPYLPGSVNDEFLQTSAFNLSAPFTVWGVVAPDFTNGTGRQQNAKIINKSNNTSFPATNPFVLWGMGTDASSPAKFIAAISTGVSGSLVVITGTTTIVQGRPYWVAMTYDGTMLRLFVNGKEEASTATTLAVGSNSVPVVFGGYNTNVNIADNWWKGNIVEIRIYEEVKTPAQIARMYEDPWGLYREELTRQYTHDVGSVVIVSNDETVNWGSEGTSQNSVSVNWESEGSAISSSVIGNWETLKGISQNALPNWENTGTSQNSVVAQWETLFTQIIGTHAANYEVGSFVVIPNTDTDPPISFGEATVWQGGGQRANAWLGGPSWATGWQGGTDNAKVFQG